MPEANQTLAWVRQQKQALRDALDLSQAGADYSVRAVVGGLDKPEDRLATLRKYYPDAEPYGEDNFVFTDPETGRRTIYNPAGLDVGDLASQARLGAQMLGGAVGGIAAAPSAAIAGPAGPAAGMGLGAAAGDEIYQLGQRLLGGAVDTRGPIERLRDAAITAGGNAIAPAATEAIVGRVVPQALGALRYGGRGAGMTDTGAAVREAAARQGIEDALTVGQSTQNRTAQRAESMLAQFPGSSGTMVAALERPVAAVDERMAQLAQQAAGGGVVPSGPEAIGGGIQGAARRAQQAFARRVGTDMDAAYTLVGEDRPVPLDNVRQLRQELAAAAARAPQSVTRYQPAIDAIDNLIADADAGGGGIGFRALREARGDLDAVRLAPDGPPAPTATQLGRVASAINQDMDAAAAGVSPEARAAWRRYNARIEAYRRPGGAGEIIDQLAKPGQTPNAMQLLLKGDKGGVRELAQLRGQVDADTWGELAGGYLDSLGRAMPGQQNAAGDKFSFSTFLTNWNKVSPDARQVLLGGTRLAPIRASVDDLATVMHGLKDSMRTAGHSNTGAINAFADMFKGLVTAGSLSAMGVGGGLMTGGTTAATMGGAYVLARLMSNPAGLRGLANLGLAAQGSNASFLGELGRLVANTEIDPMVRQWLRPHYDKARRELGAPR